MRYLKRPLDIDGHPIVLGAFYVRHDDYLVQAIRFTPFRVLIGPGLVGCQVITRTLLRPTGEPLIMTGAFDSTRAFTASTLKRFRMRRD